MPYLLFLCLLGFDGNTTAQTTASKQVTLNFTEIMEIKVTPGQENVAIDMNQLDHFTNGSSSGILQDHLTVNSISAYEVQVKASAATFIGPGTVPVPVSVISIEAFEGSSLAGVGNQPTQISLQSVILGNTGSPLINSGNFSIEQKFDVKYTIPAAQANEFFNKAPGTYTTTVQYTIIAN